MVQRVENTSPDKRNPMLDLPKETAGFLRQLRSTLEYGREEGELEELSDAQFVSLRMADVLASRGKLPEGFDRGRYVEVVGAVEQLESSLDRLHPSIAVEEVALTLRGNVEGAAQLEALHHELMEMDSQLTEAAGLGIAETHRHMGDEQAKEHILNVEYDRTDENARLVTERADRHYSIARKLYLEQKLGTTILELSEHAREMIDTVKAGFESDELAPMPPKGEFQFLQDEPAEAANPEQPALIYERQIVRTNRDVTSPGFSGCASVLLYREGPDGTPEQESIFAHLPPHTKTGFTSYDKKFWQQQAGIEDLTGYKAKVVAGLIRSPQEIAHGLSSLGADVVAVDQVPLEMYSVLVDSQTKEMVAAGQLEEVAVGSEKADYKTIDGNVRVRNHTGKVAGVAYIP